MEAAQRKQWVRQAVEQLSDEFRSVVNLVYYQGLKYREAAEVLGIPVGTVKSRLHTAIGRLGALLGAGANGNEADPADEGRQSVNGEPGSEHR